MTEESSRWYSMYRWNLLAMKPLDENLPSWNRHGTEFKLSSVASPCWLGVHCGLWAVMRHWWHDKRSFISWWEQLIIDEESSRRDRRYCIVEIHKRWSRWVKIVSSPAYFSRAKNRLGTRLGWKVDKNRSWNRKNWHLETAIWLTCFARPVRRN